jgi:acylphosphatase
MLRRQANGWKIYGMLINLPDGQLDLISFENANDLARIQQSVDVNSGEDDTPVREANKDPEALHYR